MRSYPLLHFGLSCLKRNPKKDKGAGLSRGIVAKSGDSPKNHHASLMIAYFGHLFFERVSVSFAGPRGRLVEVRLVFCQFR